MSSEAFSWHSEAILYTPLGASISAKSSLAEDPKQTHPVAAFLKLLQDGHAPLVKSDGTSAIGPKAAVGNMFYSSSGGSTSEPKLICRSCKSWTLSFQENAKGEIEIVEGCMREGIRYPVDAMTMLLNFAMPLIFLGIFLISLWMHRKEKIIRLRGAIAAPLHGRWK